MDEFPPKFSKVLVTADPQYIPGYAGYCPQLKYQQGKTYGQLTAKLLTNPDVSHSRRRVLHTGRFPSTEVETGPRDEIWRRQNGENRSIEKMIPGYTGFVPKSQNYFSNTYAETCRKALAEFEQDQSKSDVQKSAHPLLTSNKLPEELKLNTPLTAVAKEPTPYSSVYPWKPKGTPYFMEDENPHKYFISGFTGYVPKSRFLIGTGYTVTTNKALIQFGRELKSESASLNGSEKQSSDRPPVSMLYPNQCGLMPFYTGHIPGYKFRHGHTFGKLTYNTLGMRSTETTKP